jgi:tetratricopeptide (TPR) repeat protein
MAKGDRFMESDCYFDARTCYEDGVSLCSGEGAFAALKPEFMQKIDNANVRLAERNIQEAEGASARGDVKKAADHLELVKTLTYDAALREKAELLLRGLVLPDEEEHKQPRTSSCGSCSGSSHGESSESAPADDSLPLPEYYDLLIQQLPTDQYQRYVGLGEDFAYAYVAASRDHHHEALAGLDKCAVSLPQDIYRFEKGKILHRLGNDREAEEHLRAAVQLNGGHSLARLTLALVLRENGRFQDALTIITELVAEQVMAEPALLLWAEICEASGDHEGAVNRYVELLQTSYARVAAEKLYVLLQETGRMSDAEAIFKKYLKKSCH